MHHRRRIWTAGAALTATAGLGLGASPAQAADCATPATTEAAQWQVGMQLGGAPLSLTGAGGLPAVLLGALPQSRVAVEGEHGQNLLRLNASGRLADASGPAFSGGLSDHAADVRPHPVVADEAVRGARGIDIEPPAAPAAGAQTPPEAPAQQVDRAIPQPVAAPVEVPLQVPGGESALGGRYAWVPIEGVPGLGPDAVGLPWASALALVVLVGGAGAVTVVARHRRNWAG